MQKQWILLVVCLVVWSNCHSASAQQYKGEVSGWLSGVTHKYNGDFDDDVWGFGGMLSLQYAPISRLGIEARVGLGEYRWKTGTSDIVGHPEYYGVGALYGDNYPGSLTVIEPENESRLTTIDLLVNYTLVDNIPAIPFISAGVGLVDFAPSTSEAHDPLPNHSVDAYSGTTASIPVGGGVRIPFSYRAGLILRGEYRFVFSQFLDDVNFNGKNDGLTSISLGFTYRFTNPPGMRHPWLPPHHHHRKHGAHEHCRCAEHPDHMESECPCSERLDSYGRGNGTHGHGDDEWNRDGADADAMDRDGEVGSEKGNVETIVPGKDSTQTSAPAGKADTTANATTPPPTKPTAENKTIAPCAPGLTRVCIDDDKSVCVETGLKPGARIQWEDGFVVAAKENDFNKTLRQANVASPCYDAVVRQTQDRYYLCIDCCFQQQLVGDKVTYIMVDGTIAKGAGAYVATDCPECKQLVEQGK